MFAAAVNPYGIKTLSAHGLSTLFINGKPVSRSLPRNPPDCINLDSGVFDSFTLVDKLFSKPSQRFATRLLVNNSTCGKLVSLL